MWMLCEYSNIFGGRPSAPNEPHYLEYIVEPVAEQIQMRIMRTDHINKF